MQDIFPDPTRRTPVTLPDGTEHPGTVLLSRVIHHPNIHVGDQALMAGDAAALETHAP